ncbi:calcium-binding protein [Defluviimonas sp. SAOS-178_SWC]|uniref:calcium-binding protein n=1 Tax=Defluviimonas sp. SAOS-178_SWC TaxID=3121287 RepID=UPI003221EB9F
MTLSAQEQYMLELVNRARLDPDAEAARQGIGLNDGLTAGTISSTAKEVLAPNGLLDIAASGHDSWMIANSTLDHLGSGNSLPDDRINATGYPGGSGFGYAEILGVVNANTFSTQKAAADELFRLTMLNAVDNTPGSSDREALFFGGVREAGISIQTGTYTISSSPWGHITHVPLGQSFNASVMTQNFGQVGSDVFLTGVAYDDNDNDDFYSIGEGVSGVGFAIGATATSTAAAGGYALKLAPAAGVSVTVTPQVGPASVVTVDLSAGNVKLDLVDGTLFRTSGDLTLVSGVADAELLGVANLSLTGNGADNRLTGNRGDNVLGGNAGADRIDGAAGADWIAGHSGNDTIFGGDQYDTIYGGDGNDVVAGGNGRDKVWLGTGDDIFNDNAQNDIHGWDTVNAGAGRDTINGGGGNDVFNGEDGEDWIAGGFGNDTINGGNQYDTIYAGGGNDVVAGGNGRDTVNLGAGNDVFNDNAQNDIHGWDTVNAGAGADRINGGGGNDVFNGDDGNDWIAGGIGNDTINGGNQHDTIYAGAGNDIVNGGMGRDKAWLGDGNDRYTDAVQFGFNAHDEVFGMAGNDTIHGGGGDDWLNGGTDNDVLTGGLGADSFVFLAGYGQDRVTDFADNVDTLVLDDALWGGGKTVAQVIADHASVVGGDTVFDFGGHSLTVAGVTNLGIFVDDINIV